MYKSPQTFDWFSHLSIFVNWIGNWSKNQCGPKFATPGKSSRVPQLTCTWMSGASGLGRLTRKKWPQISHFRVRMQKWACCFSASSCACTQSQWTHKFWKQTQFPIGQASRNVAIDVILDTRSGFPLPLPTAQHAHIWSETEETDTHDKTWAWCSDRDGTRNNVWTWAGCRIRNYGS